MKRPLEQTRTFEVHIPNFEGDGIAEIVPLDVKVTLDPETGEEILTPESLELIEKTKSRRMGLLLPEEIKELRERLNLTQHELSDLLQLGEKSYTRWETGRARPSRSMNVLLRALRDGRISLDYLRERRQPATSKFATREAELELKEQPSSFNISKTRAPKPSPKART